MSVGVQDDGLVPEAVEVIAADGVGGTRVSVVVGGTSAEGEKETDVVEVTSAEGEKGIELEAFGSEAFISKPSMSRPEAPFSCLFLVGISTVPVAGQETIKSRASSVRPGVGE